MFKNSEQQGAIMLSLKGCCEAKGMKRPSSRASGARPKCMKAEALLLFPPHLFFYFLFGFYPLYILYLVLYIIYAKLFCCQVSRSAAPFPPVKELINADVLKGAELFPWAKRFWERAITSGLNIESYATVFNLATEFSGSGCAEAAAMSVANHSGRPLTINLQHAADYDPSCRRVLLDSCHCLSSFSLLVRAESMVVSLGTSWNYFLKRFVRLCLSQ